MASIYFPRNSLSLRLIGFLLVSVFSSTQAVAQNENRVLSGMRDGITSLVVKDSCLKNLTVDVLPQDEVWEINGRDCHCNEDISTMQVKRLIGLNWEVSDLQHLIDAHATDKTKSTLICFHGNRTDEEWAISRGLQYYDNVFSKSTCPRTPVRYVIFSWRSEKDQLRAARDYDQNSKRAVSVGRAVSVLLNQFSDRQMLLSGFSLGAQVILSALENIASQCDDPRCCEIKGGDPNRLPGQYRVALIAPALAGSYAAEQQFHYPDQRFVARTEIFDNHLDRALRMSNFVRRRQATSGDISIAQLARNQNLPLGTVRIRDVANSVGKGHSIDRYTSDPLINQSILELVGEVFQSSVFALSTDQIAPEVMLEPTLAPPGP